MICHSRIAGRYKMVVRRTDNSIRLETAWFDNLVTNLGMNQIATTGPELCTQCYIGRSANVPAITDSQLGSIISTANSVSVPTYTFFDGDEPFWRAYKIFTFNAGNATGDVREVGVGPTPVTLFSRALVQGVEEVPITITVLSDEKLEVYYERRNYINRLDSINGFQITRGPSVFDPYAATIRASDIDVVPNIFRGHKDNDGVSFAVYEQKFLGTLYQPISGVAATGALTQVSTYIANSYYLDYDFQFDQTQGIYVSGIGTAMFHCNQGRWQALFNPYVFKPANYRMRFKVRTSWSRYVPAL